tara:strand:+ start:1727 stop:1837 length:111 start_codon:yes stop_codon:yes gene_type:complete
MAVKEIAVEVWDSVPKIRKRKERTVLNFVLVMLSKC